MDFLTIYRKLDPHRRQDVFLAWAFCKPLIPNYLLILLLLVSLQYGVVQPLIGDPSQKGYREGVGAGALFDNIRGVAPLEDRYIIADSNNHCLRSVFYETEETTTFAGLCGNHGKDDGPLETARFFWPKGISSDLKDLNFLYLCSSDIREIDLTQSTVITLITPSVGSFTGGILWRMNRLLVAVRHGLQEYDLEEKQFKWLLGDTGIGEACNNCSADSAYFYEPTAMHFISSTIIILTNSLISKLRVFDIDLGMVSAIGGMMGHVDGYFTDVQLTRPQSLYIDHQYIYISEDKTVRKLEYSGKIATLNHLLL